MKSWLLLVRVERDSVYEKQPPTRLVSLRLRKISRPYAWPRERASNAAVCFAWLAVCEPWPPPPLRSPPIVPGGKRGIPQFPREVVGCVPGSPASVSDGNVP